MKRENLFTVCPVIIYQFTTWRPQCSIMLVSLKCYRPKQRVFLDCLVLSAGLSETLNVCFFQDIQCITVSVLFSTHVKFIFFNSISTNVNETLVCLNLLFLFCYSY